LQAALRADAESHHLPLPVHGERVGVRGVAALQEIDTGASIREGRVHGGALYKMEPKELGRMSGEPIVEAMGGCRQGRQGILFADA
jgi:hypothetical protein